MRFINVLLTYLLTYNLPETLYVQARSILHNVANAVDMPFADENGIGSAVLQFHIRVIETREKL